MYRRNDDFILREIVGEYMLIPVGKAVAAVTGMITLSSTSAFIWNLLETPKTLEELVQETTKTYEVTTAHAESEISQLLEKLLALGMAEKL